VNLEVIILAAGMGTRMKSAKPKVLHELAGRPLLHHLVSSVRALSPTKIHLVIGKGAEQVEASFPNDDDLNFVLQLEQLGTGHAVQQALPHCQSDSQLLVLLGDAPHVRSDTMAELIQSKADLTLLTVELEAPDGYGRIARNAAGTVEAIIEHRDASLSQRQIKEINTGVMAGSFASFSEPLSQIGSDNDQGEYLLTDVVAELVKAGKSVNTVITPYQLEAMAVNDMVQLAQLERETQLAQAETLMRQGVRLLDPARFDLRGSLIAGQDVTIDINVIIEGEVSLGDGVTIGPNCVITNCVIEAGTEVKANSVLEGAVISNNCRVGPFARLRPGTELSDEVSIGNFVEVKKTVIGVGSKASHLSYLGDAFIGSGVNIGAGTITCNYDGVNKHITRIEDGVFVGSNTALVAPVEVSAGATIAAGSTITKQIPKKALGIARGRQKNIEGWNGPRVDDGTED